MNLIKSYMDFKKNQIVECSKLIYDLKDDFFYECLSKFSDIYIQTRYYRFYETFGNSEVFDNNINVIMKELKGKKVEIELINESKDPKIVELSFYLVAYSIKIGMLDNLDELKKIIDTCLRALNMNDDSVYAKVDKFMKQMKFREEKFISSLNINNYKLKYSNYKNRQYDYDVKLMYEINQLDIYPKASISKNYNDIDVSDNKYKLIFNLLNKDILQKLISNEELDKYYVYIDDCMLDSLLFSMIENSYLRKYIVLVVDFDNYSNQKRKLNNLNKHFDLCGLVDMSHINDAQVKLDSLDEIEMFKYYLFDKVKNKDYEIVLKFDFINKIGFINELEKE